MLTSTQLIIMSMDRLRSAGTQTGNNHPTPSGLVASLQSHRT